MNNIEISKKIYNLLNGIDINGRVYQFNRPQNSNKTDVVISNGYIEVLANNTTTDNTAPNLREFERVAALIAEIIPPTEKKAEPQRNKDGYWSVILSFSSLVSVQDGFLRTYESLSDGYGGVTTFHTETPCNVFITSENLNNQMNMQGGRFEIIPEVKLVINKKARKNNSVIIGSDEYVINGVRGYELNTRKKND